MRQQRAQAHGPERIHLRPLRLGHAGGRQRLRPARARAQPGQERSRPAARGRAGAAAELCAAQHRHRDHRRARAGAGVAHRRGARRAAPARRQAARGRRGGRPQHSHRRPEAGRAAAGAGGQRQFGAAQAAGGGAQRNRQAAVARGHPGDVLRRRQQGGRAHRDAADLRAGARRERARADRHAERKERHAPGAAGAEALRALQRGAGPAPRVHARAAGAAGRARAAGGPHRQHAQGRGHARRHRRAGHAVRRRGAGDRLRPRLCAGERAQARRADLGGRERRPLRPRGGDRGVGLPHRLQHRRRLGRAHAGAERRAGGAHRGRAGELQPRPAPGHRGPLAEDSERFDRRTSSCCRWSMGATTSSSGSFSASW
jgi:hypothetical protein